MFFNSTTKLRAELPDKGRVIVPRDRKAIDSPLPLNSSSLLFHLITHFALPDRAGVLLLDESHVSGPSFIAQPIDECEMHHARLYIDLVPTPAPSSRQPTVAHFGHWSRQRARDIGSAQMDDKRRAAIRRKHYHWVS